ncbi:hypothetical protein OIU74_023845 [Salix koriyanagi]|uniref:Uncharacterized protein n=1 Tax=Salix koriyanagi TaxID=2511006 RepID=A0A9Q1AB66_9ROSI|nr:hypothetical protein OIU74_023845 [Salix koriyanagi]
MCFAYICGQIRVASAFCNLYNNYEIEFQSCFQIDSTRWVESVSWPLACAFVMGQ